MLRMKCADGINPYTYLLKFKVDGQTRYYYGVRYGNVRLGRKISEDLFVHYFTSSKSVRALLEMGIKPFEMIVHRRFNDRNQACQFEVQFLQRIKAASRPDFINQIDKFDNSLVYSGQGIGRVVSLEVRKKISIGSGKWQADPEYRKQRKAKMKAMWQDPAFVSKMKKKNDEFWYSEKGREYVRTRRPATLGQTHTKKTRARMSQTHKELAKSIDFRERASHRKRFECPICNKPSLDGGNFNRHMIGQHDWTSDQCKSFKS